VNPRRPAALALVALALSLTAGFGSPAAQAQTLGLAAPGVLLPTGRLATPAGSPYDSQRQKGDASYDLGDFPVGLTLSPHGRLAVASLNGYGQGVPPGFNSTCQADTAGAGGTCPGVPAAKKSTRLNHAPDEGLDVVDLQTGKVTQVVAIPTNHDAKKPRACGTTMNCFGIGVSFSPDGSHVYATGAGGDQVFDFAVTGTTLKLAHTVKVPSLIEQTPAAPVVGKTNGNPRGLAVTPDGKSLLVTAEFDSTIAMYDLTPSGPVLAAQGLLPGGISNFAPVAYLYAVTVSPDSAFAYVTAQGTGVVYAVNLALLHAAGTGTATALSTAVVPAATVVPGLDHPTGLAISPDGSTLAVTGSNSDNVVFLPVSAGVPHLPAVTVATAAADHHGTKGAVANAVAWAKDGSRAYVALAGDDAVSVVDPAAGTQLGTIPTGWYPTAVAVGPTDGRIYALSAKGLGSRYLPALGYTARPGTHLPTGGGIPSADYYDGDNMPGLLTRVAPPNPTRLAAYTATAQADVLHATGLDQRPADSPIPATVGGASPIKHVVYVVRENRTYDQVLGDVVNKRKDSDGDPGNAVLAPAVPNAHGITNRFATADHFFSDGEASVQGHWWTSSANSADYMEKSWRQYYSPRNRPYDPIGTVVNPPGCSIFQNLASYQLTHPTFTYRNYGELVGAASDNTNAGALTTNSCGVSGPAGPGSVPTDPSYPNQLTLVPDDRTRAAEFLKDSGLTLEGKNAGNGNSLRNFSYLILSEDHTSGLAGTNTPRSQVAQNDQALGQIVSGLSTSTYWDSTAVFVVEDDSQDGFDHVDGHRNVLLVASPWSRQVSGDGCAPGYIGHAHYDQASVLRTMELILGLPPMSTYDDHADPLYDLFQPTSQLNRLTAGSPAPYGVKAAPPFVDETVASLPKTAKNTQLIALAKGLDVSQIDRAGPLLEAQLWQSLTSRPLPPALSDGLVRPDELATAQASDTAPALVRPGVAPVLSTVTGQVSTAATRCSAVGRYPVAKPVAHPVTGRLAATGSSTRLVVIALALLLAAVLVRPRRRPRTTA
jgi:YVTN family beta-propeller protein